MKPDVYSYAIKPNSKEPVIKGAVSLPVPNDKKRKMVFGGSDSDEDIEICLNCELPAAKCHGLDKCYAKQKRVEEKRAYETHDS